MPDKPTIFRVIGWWPNKLSEDERKGSITVQINIPLGAALPRELVSLADYEALDREWDARLERKEQMNADSHLAALNRADAAEADCREAVKIAKDANARAEAAISQAEGRK